METRVLTLFDFDDEDFLPREEPKKKTSKKKEAAAATVDTDHIPVPAGGTDALPAADALLPPETPVSIPHPQAEPVTGGTEDTTPDTAAPDTASAPGDLYLSHAEAVQDPAGSDGQAADEELNRQIVSELIQLDYTALIHKEYPFDVNNAQVVRKEKAPAPSQAQPAPAAEEEAPAAPLPEWTLDKNYYTIGEVAQLFKVNTSHIRFWTNEFRLKPRTTRKGDRLYSPADIAELRLIHHLVKEKKHTIKGAREKLKAEKNGIHNKLDLKESLTELRSMLIRIREQL